VTPAPSVRARRDGSLHDLLRYFLRLGAVGFGGPVALVGYMQRDLVEQRRWFTAEEYREGLALAQLAPGPLAAQLAMYLGWVQGKALGAALVGLAFVAPSFVMVVAIAVAYMRFGGMPWMQGAFYGIGAAVIAIVARSAVRLTGLTLGRDRLLWALFAFAALVTAWTESEIVWVFVGAGLVALVVRTATLSRSPPVAMALALLPPGLLTGLTGQPASAGVLWQIATYFTEAGAFVFGSGLAIVPFLHAGVVQRFAWLDERQFLDAVAVAMITPGPVVITVGFIGYLAAGAAGAVVAALATFLPCYLFTVIPAPHFRRLSRNQAIRAFVDGVTAAATGAIAGAVFVLGRRALVDATTAAVAVATLVVLVRFKRVPEPAVIAAAGALGILLGSAAPHQPPEPALVQERDPVALLAQPPDLQQLPSAVPPRGLEGVGPPADQHGDDRRRHPVDDGPRAPRGPHRVAPGLAEDAGEGHVRPLERLPHPRLQRGRPLAERLDQLVRALVPLPPLADAPVDDLLQVVAARQPPDLGGADPLARVPFHQHAQELAHLIHVVARLPLGDGALDDVAGGGERVQHVGRRPPAVALLPDDPEVSQLQAAALAHEDVHGRQVAVEQLAAVELAQDLEDARDLPPRHRLRPTLGGAAEEGPQVALAGVLQRQAVEHAVLAQERERVEDADGPRVAVQ
jgi:chromate transporter